MAWEGCRNSDGRKHGDREKLGWIFVGRIGGIGYSGCGGEVSSGEK